MKSQRLLLIPSSVLTCATIIYCFIIFTIKIEDAPNDLDIVEISNLNESLWSWDRKEFLENYDSVHRSEFVLFNNQHRKFRDSITIDLIDREKQNWQNYTKIMNITDKEYNGRGIVYSSFPAVLTQTIVSIRFHRFYGCNLPIEVWYLYNLVGITMNYLLNKFCNSSRNVESR